MRLIDAKALVDTGSLSLRTVPESQPPAYAILSHRWVDGEEVTFEDAKSYEVSRRKGGFFKIQRSCAEALKANLRFVWIGL